VLGEQQIACRFAPLRIADKKRNNMAVARHHRQPRRRERGLGVRRRGRDAVRVPIVRSSGDGWRRLPRRRLGRKCGGEDETGST
jgi:hypothetical protein